MGPLLAHLTTERSTEGMMRITLWAMMLGLHFNVTVSQAQYVTNGTATQLSCNCYRLTLAQNAQFGSVWNENMISLTEPFDFTFDVFLGYNPAGADGIAFVLQPISTSIGVAGGGLGYQGIDPSLAVEIDTYQNGQFGDPSYDHVAIMANGITDHNSASNLAGPFPALPGNLNIADGQEHLFRVSWDPAGQTMRVYMDGSLRLEYTGDIIGDIFADDPMVFWGFTGSTGGLNNEQRFCLAILPGMQVTVPQLCAGDSVLVLDSSYSALGSVVEWQWDFGNGQTSQVENPGHVTYTEPGQYYIVQSVVDAAGCDATDSTLLVVVPNPVAAFTATEVCQGDPTLFTDQSSVPQGSVSGWQWEFVADGETSGMQNPAYVYDSPGTVDVTLTVTTAAGCTAQTTGEVTVNPLPEPDVTHESVGTEASFTAWTDADETVQWLLEDTIITAHSFSMTFPDSGWYSVTLVTTSDLGCADTLVYEFYLDALPDFEVPNVFTPNGDDINDRFEPYTYAISEVNMRIFNRWGRPVHTYEGPLDPGLPWGWDGSVNGGAEAAAGTYFFMLDMIGIDGARFTEQGTVTLVR